jgi:hypothetical protein
MAMKVMKSVLAGLVAVLLFAILVIVAFTVAARVRSASMGFVGIQFLPGVFIIAAIFAAGFVWEFRRALRRH